MKRIPIKMKRADLLNIPDYELPDGFRIRFFEEGDEEIWAMVETAVGEFSDESAALRHFNHEFGAFPEEIAKRCLFLETDDGEVIGTTTAWYGVLEGEEKVSGRIHWVGIVPDYQRKKLSKPLLSRALRELAKYHDSAYLISQTSSYRAINLYLQFGFEPFLTDAYDIEAWKLLENILGQKLV